MAAGRGRVPVGAWEPQTCTLVKEGETSRRLQQRLLHRAVHCSKGVIRTQTAFTGSGLTVPWHKTITKYTAIVEKNLKKTKYDKFYSRASDGCFIPHLLRLLCLAGNKEREMNEIKLDYVKTEECHKERFVERREDGKMLWCVSSCTTCSQWQEIGCYFYECDVKHGLFLTSNIK